VRSDVLTAFALFRECAADTAKAKEKYAGKAIEVTGVYAGSLAEKDGTTLYLLTGQAARVKCVLDVTDKATVKALRDADVKGIHGGLQFFTLRGKFGGVGKGEDKRTKFAARRAGGDPVEKGPVLFVRLSGCKVVATSAMKLE